MNYKDGIYEGDYGVTYFVLDNKVLTKHLGTMYKSSILFLFGEWRYPLTDEMKLKFNEAYSHKKIKVW